MTFQSAPGLRGPGDLMILAHNVRDSIVSIRARPARAGRRDRALHAVSISARPARAGRPIAVRVPYSVETFQSAPGPRGPGDCGPAFRLSRRGFIAHFRQPANSSRILLL